jgi:hypothetical protein
MAAPMKKPHPHREAFLILSTVLFTAAGLRAGEVQTDAKSSKDAIVPESNPLCFADGRLCFDVQDRLRLEVRDNNFDFFNGHNDAADDTFLLQRFRLGVLWKPAPWLQFYVQGQDSREVDSKRPNIPGLMGAEGDDNFDLRQAWFQVGSDAFPLSLKAGRQTLVYGDERLIGNFDWNNFGRVFDAVKLSWTQPKWQLDAFASSVVVIQRDKFDQSDLFNGNENDRQQVFSGLYLTANQMPWGSLELYALWLSEANGTVSNVQSGVATVRPKGDALLAQHSSFGTFGGRLHGTPEKLRGWEFDVEGAYQNGEVEDLALNAFAVHAGFGYNFACPCKPRLWFEYNFASGDHDPNDKDSETFQNLFPTNHKFYGYMDLFSWQNMHNPEISLKLSPLKKLTAELDYHAFWLADTNDFWYRANGLTTVRPLSPHAGNFVGTELDFVLTWNVCKNLSLQAGYCHFFAGDYLKNTGPSDGANFGYTMATLNF